MRQELAIFYHLCRQTIKCSDKRQKNKKKKNTIRQFSASFSADTTQTTGGRAPMLLTAGLLNGGFP
jgi:hypothetical protein